MVKSFPELSMSHAQRCEGLCSITFCSCCIRPGRTTDRFGRCCCCCNAKLSPDAALETITHKHLTLASLRRSTDYLITRVSNSRASKLVQNCVEMQPWIESDHNCQFAEDSQRASLGLHHHAFFSSFHQHTNTNESITKSIPNLEHFNTHCRILLIKEHASTSVSRFSQKV